METQESKRKKLILVEDDEPWYAGPVKDALEFEGYSIVTARTGAEAVAAAKAHKPDLLILDMMMNPGDLQGDHANGTRTGRLVLEKLRGLPGMDSKELPAICLTVLRDEDLRKTMASLGADYLCKEEVTPDDIIRAVFTKIGPP